jgi:hypothetical protein
VDLLKAIEPPDTRTHGEGDAFQYHHDYAIDWGFHKDRYGMRLFITSHSKDFPHSVLCIIALVANPKLTERMVNLIDSNLEWAADILFSSFMRDELNKLDGIILIEGDTEAIHRGAIIDPNLGFGSDFEIRARRLGPDPGQDLIYEWISVFDFVFDRHIRGIRDAVTEQQAEEYDVWLRINPLVE